MTALERELERLRYWAGQPWHNARGRRWLADKIAEVERELAGAGK